MICVKKVFLSSILSSLLIFSVSGHAATVKAVKGKKLLVSADGSEIKKGQIYFVLRNGKRIGIIKLRAIKGSTGLAVLGKGKAAKGDNLELRAAKGSSQQQVANQSRDDDEAVNLESIKEKAYWGFMGGISQASASVKDANTSQTFDISGMGFSFKGVFDFPLFSLLWFRGMTGIEQLKADGDRTIDITYLAFDFWGRLKFGSGNTTFWGGAGFDLLFPLSKSSTALTESSITNTSVLAIGGGFDYQLSPTSYIPFQIEYNIYPSSDQVEAKAIAVRAGYMKKF